VNGSFLRKALHVSGDLNHPLRRLIIVGFSTLEKSSGALSGKIMLN
jgi:hypothetical protein